MKFPVINSQWQNFDFIEKVIFSVRTVLNFFTTLTIDLKAYSGFFLMNLKRSRSWIYLLSRINWKWVLYLPQIVRQLLKLTVSWTFIVTLLITKFTNKIVCRRFQLSQMKMSIYNTIGKWNEAMKIEFYMLDS